VLELKVVKECNGANGVLEMAAATPMVAEDAPVLESGDRMLHASSPPAMAAPDMVTDDPVATKHGRRELRKAAIAAICENALVRSTKHRDG
jgi:hypothetical protein